ALHAAVASGAPILALYVHDDEAGGAWRPGRASGWWLQRSLARLGESLDGRLHLLRGDAGALIPDVARAFDVRALYFNRCVEPWRVAQDRAIRRALVERDVAVHAFNGAYLFDPAVIAKPDGTPYRVFTPYYRKGCLERGRPPREPLPAPDTVVHSGARPAGALSGDASLPRHDWRPVDGHDWRPGETGAASRLQRFLASGLGRYAAERDRPDLASVSRLSPHLHFGELSPHQAWHAVVERIGPGALRDDRFLTELGWREFSAYLLFREPRLPEANLQKKFDRFPWRDDRERIDAWQQGRTGVPIVDAGMRELLTTGYMHNRVRMIAASYLVKNLMQHWRHGAAWFWERLVDADLGNNSASWQWVAGSGADAAPFFRVFNPVTQGGKFDPHGGYVRRHVPELAGLPDKHVHSPWRAPAGVLEAAGLVLGRDYPQPMVDLGESRRRALAAFQGLGAPGGPQSRSH
ncbi:MAG: DNA photolyase family protein, partial [Proteobacteria bacterium]|nr:DNA photolyase family protein [Pseudomonadota bacterium]